VEDAGFGARMSKKAVRGAALKLQTPTAGSGRGRPTRTGHAERLPGELTLFMSGRKEAAEITLDGDATAIAIVRAANFGV